MSGRIVLAVVGAFVMSTTSTLWAEVPKAKVDRAVDIPAFTADLYAKVAQKKGNLFFSPTSIETALAMTYAGANGSTSEQMAKTLHFNLPADKVSTALATLIETLNHPPEIETWEPSVGGGAVKAVKKPAYQLVVANALWGQKDFPFKPDFTQLLQKSYRADVHPTDFGDAEKSRTTINDWVALQTKDKIKDLLAKGVLTTDTRLVLTNAIYFKSNWAEPFQKSATKDGPFKLSADKSVNVPLMQQEHDHGYLENDDLQMLEMAYSRSVLSMIVLLPKKAEGLAEVEKKLTAENLAGWLKDKKKESVKVTLPKFTLSAELMLADALKEMGMVDAFDPNKADFSGITTAEKLFISAVIHKAFVAVDEEGTEAAAATAVVMRTTAMPMPKKSKIFEANHPFVFLIRHNSTGEILFIGRVANPKGE